MIIKQSLNGAKGEARTNQILTEYFYVKKRNIDIDGADFIVEIPFDNLKDLRDFNEEGIVQAKYFENNNQVKIHREYVEDEDGPRINFFAILHTDNECGKKERYFFSAKEIRENFRLAILKSGEYYVFRLSSKNPFGKFKGLTDDIINHTIAEGIKRTEEYNRLKLSHSIEGKLINPQRNVLSNANENLSKSFKDKHIVDMLYCALNEFKDFRRITPWRLIDKIDFRANRQTTTYYNQFALNTSHKEILKFFASINLEKDASVYKASFFKGVKDAPYKTKQIIKTLNDNLIIKLVDLSDKHNNKNIQIFRDKCQCMNCQFDQLALKDTYSILKKEGEASRDLWNWMQDAYVYFRFGEYHKALELYKRISKKAIENKEPIISFLAKYNQKFAARKTYESSYPDLDSEVQLLNTSTEKKDVLKSIANHTLLFHYTKEIDSIYLSIKEYKERRFVNDSVNLVSRLYANIAEYFNFMEGNYLLSICYSETEQIVEKVIESCLLSYSMKTEYSKHLDYFEDFLVKLSVHYCKSNKLLAYFQRNNIKVIPYKSSSNYFQNTVTNFFAKENVDFLFPEICYFKNRTNNPDLRQKVKNIFENLCILLTYLDAEIKLKGLLKDISYFIKKLDFNIHEVWLLSLPLLNKPGLFTNNEVLELIKILLSEDKLREGYLLTNCLYSLYEKDDTFQLQDAKIIESLIDYSIDKPDYDLIKILPLLLPEHKSIELDQRIEKSLKAKFNPELFYQSVISKNLMDPMPFMELYLHQFKSFSEKPEEQKYQWQPSSFTGIDFSIRQKLNNLVEVVLIINDKKLLQNPIIEGITSNYPYYHFVLNTNELKQDDLFDYHWLLENQSEIVLKKLAQNQSVKKRLKEELEKKFHKLVSEIYIKYF